MAPAPNPQVLTQLQRADAVIYGMGSLYTSILPSLVLRGVGECIAATNVPKVGPLWGWGGVWVGRCGAERWVPACAKACREGDAGRAELQLGGRLFWPARLLLRHRSVARCHPSPAELPLVKRGNLRHPADLPPEWRH